MKKPLLCAAGFVLVFGSVANAAAAMVTIDFGTTAGFFNPYTEDSYVVGASTGAVRITGLNIFARSTSGTAQPTSGFNNAHLILAKGDGGVFDLLSFGLDDPSLGVAGFQIIGTRPNLTTLVSNYTTRVSPGFNRFTTTGFTGLQSVAFGTNSGPRLQNVGLDNLLVNDYANVVSTPIPGTLILFLSGLVGLLVARRLN